MTRWDEQDHPRDPKGQFATKGPAGESGVVLSPERLPGLVVLPGKLSATLEDLHRAGLRPMLVGGAVRDALLGVSSPKDLDFEVYGGDQAQLEQVLSRHGRPSEVGAQFSVTTMRIGATSVDFSLPRRENKTGSRHKDFEVVADGGMGFAEASARRDFTINSMMWDPDTGELVDPHGGRPDLDSGVLRHVSDAFDEDPLRVLRGAQFAARYDMGLDPGTRERCRSLADQYQYLSDERVRGEFGKLASRGIRPSAGLAVLTETEWHERFPGRAGLDREGIGDDADRITRLGEGADRRLLLGALLAERMDSDTAHRFLSRTVEGARPQSMAFGLSRREVLPETAAQARHQAHGAIPIRVRAHAEMVFGNPAAGRSLRVAEEAGVADFPQKDLLAGADVMALTQRRPGPWMGQVLREARQAQADGLFGDGPEAKSRAVEWLSGRVAEES